MNFNNIFSNEISEQKRIIRILGIKITLKQKTPELKNGIKGLPKDISTWKHNPCINNDAYKILSSLKKVNTIVDFGAGDGFWGKLCKYIYPNATITGVELEPSYIEKNNLRKIYDNIINKSILDVCTEMSGDLLICGDVLEHLPKKDCLKVINSIKGKYKYILINGPIGFQEQIHEIPSEIHRCGLDKKFFKELNIKKWKTYQNNTMFMLFAKGEVCNEK